MTTRVSKKKPASERLAGGDVGTMTCGRRLTSMIHQNSPSVKHLAHLRAQAYHKALAAMLTWSVAKTTGTVDQAELARLRRVGLKHQAVWKSLGREVQR